MARKSAYRLQCEGCTQDYPGHSRIISIVIRNYTLEIISNLKKVQYFFSILFTVVISNHKEHQGGRKPSSMNELEWFMMALKQRGEQGLESEEADVSRLSPVDKNVANRI